jgi:DNA-binding transcriptional LysR family regulator
MEICITGQYVDLVEEGIDIALRMEELADSSLSARQLIVCTLRVCAAPAFWQKHGKPVHPGDLNNYNCLIYTQSPNAGSLIFRNQDGEKFHVKVNGNLKSDTGKLILDAGIRGQGVFLTELHGAELSCIRTTGDGARLFPATVILAVCGLSLWQNRFAESQDIYRVPGRKMEILIIARHW